MNYIISDTTLKILLNQLTALPMDIQGKIIGTLMGGLTPADQEDIINDINGDEEMN